MNPTDWKDTDFTWTLEKILAHVGWKEDSIKRLYYGKSHCCRCGCGGKYHERGSRGFKRYMNMLKRGVMLAHDWTKADISSRCYVNVDLAGTNDRCICLYIS